MTEVIKPHVLAIKGTYDPSTTMPKVPINAMIPENFCKTSSDASFS